MKLSTVDWGIIGIFFLVSLIIGFVVSKRSGKDTSEFFLSGKNMPWWLLGVSMVATTFSADTPNLVTDIVRKNGVSGNWVWWAFLLTGMLTVFVYARLWRRSEVMTDMEFYELRYSGKAAAFLRGFRSFYLGFLLNIMIMATVCLAAIKIGGVILGLSPLQTLMIASIITVLYSTIGGLKGVIYTDFFQFIFAMIGAVWAAYVVVQLPQVGGLENLFAHQNVSDKLNFFPDFTDTSTVIPLLIIPIAVQWWAAWYPGAEPGGGGYIAQRMLSAKDEKNALGATLFFNIAHYALRPWPWIIIALASLIVFPDMASLQAAFPHVDSGVINDDLAYPAMLTLLPAGLIGLVVASLISAFMSTISTHLNWGSSYLVLDCYKRFINKTADEKHLVMMGRISIVILMVLAAASSLLLTNAKEAFDILVMLGAGTGLLFILRWFWWRINAYSEISAMIASFIVALTFQFFIDMPQHWEFVCGVGITTAIWVTVTLLTEPVDKKTLVSFYRKIQPYRSGWEPIAQEAGPLQKTESKSNLPREILSMFLASIGVFAILFGTGYWLYGVTLSSVICFALALILIYILFRMWSPRSEVV